jgi:cytoskeleton protein RodZ
VFEIGSSLRAVREHQQLELSQVEQATRIRARYLQALEDERFDVLPGAAYAKGFLRTYADYLGLDAQRFVDEYDARFAPAEILEAAPLVRVRRPRRLLGARLVVLPLAAAVAVFIWRTTSSGGHHHAAFRPAPPHVPVSTAARPLPAATPHRPRTARIAFVAARGSCWLSVRRGSEAGKVVYERVLERGQTTRFAGTRFWIRLGAPWNVDATLNGKRAQLPSAIGNVVVTAGALRIITG